MVWKRIICILMCLGICTVYTTAQNNFGGSYNKEQYEWVESSLGSMTLEEKIAQLMMVRAYSNKGSEHKAKVTELVEKYKVGGLLFFQGTPNKQVQLTNFYQQITKTPLLIGIDGEWGLAMRLDNTPTFPRQLMLGAIQDNNLLYDMGKEVAKHCKRMGIHINLAPVVDVNNNINNPVINDRSFGENKYNVAQKSVAYMQGMEMNGVLACAKHFPGHGDTDKDSHHTLPIIKHSKNRLDSLELYPFREMIKRGVSGVMMAHLAIPALDSRSLTGAISADIPTMPSSLSKPIVTGLLKEEMGYEGLIITDGLGMRGVSDYFSAAEIAQKALLAGNDILLLPRDVPGAIELIKKSIASGEITELEIDERVRKVLRAKFRVGLNSFEPISEVNLIADLNNMEAELLKRKLVEKSLTLAMNEDGLVPMRKLEKEKMASVALGASGIRRFQKSLSKYAPIEHFQLDKAATGHQYKSMLEQLKSYSTVFVSLHDMSKYASKKFGLNRSQIDFIHALRKETEVILTIFGSPYSLRYFDGCKHVLVAYDEKKVSQELSAQLLFGAISASGRLPVSVSDQFLFGQGAFTYGNMRMKYTYPEEVGIRSSNLKGIDVIAEEAIRDGATPGCQVLVVKENKVIFQKSYGHHTYARKQAVSDEDLYDLASITKIAASLPALMQMYEGGAWNLESTLGDLMPSLKNTNKGTLRIRDILIHQSGLVSWIPFYQKTINSSGYPAEYYRKDKGGKFSVLVADGLYMDSTYVDTIWQRILNSNVKPVGDYVYSDVGYYFFKNIIEQHFSKPMEDYLSQELYSSLGMNTLCYHPLQRFSKECIVPTEDERHFRRQLLQGHVHDQGAAMLGGVGGHAGLFSNANDLAKLGQMYLNGGVYGGCQYFEAETLELFAGQQDVENRRGLAFDKPQMDTTKVSPTCSQVSASAFGHTGFTGTCIWVDPAHDLVYIFLSNRVYPDMNNWKLVKNDIRPRIQEVIYRAIEAGMYETVVGIPMVE